VNITETSRKRRRNCTVCVSEQYSSSKYAVDRWSTCGV